jgi:16S rRNA (adenine1518-N6/adenine1519-N6)-dimethyltransferase
MDTRCPSGRKLVTLSPAVARQHLGQHFLADLGWRRRILESLPLGGSEPWVEIGAGRGEMTQFLAAPGRHLIAVETDRRLTADFESRLRREPDKWPGVKIVAGDVLKIDLRKLVRGRFRVYGNLPYYITSPILHHLFAFAEQIVSMHLVVQWEVACRIAAPPGRREYGYLSVVCQFYTRPEIVMRIPPGAFRPPPQVSSALVTMTLPGSRASVGAADEQRFLKFVQACFRQKRKTLRNNLLGAVEDDRIQVGLAACGLRADARAEQLSLAQFAALFRDLKAHPPRKA